MQLFYVIVGFWSVEHIQAAQNNIEENRKTSKLCVHPWSVYLKIINSVLVIYEQVNLFSPLLNNEMTGQFELRSWGVKTFIKVDCWMWDIGHVAQ